MIRRILALVLLVVLCGAVPASAQINDASVKGGNIEKLPMERPILEYALAGGFLLAAMALGFKASKRTNE